MKSKQDIRTEIAEQRRALEPQWLDTTSAQVVDNIQLLNAFRTAETVALYMAIGGEVDPNSLFPICWALEKKTCIPVFNTDTKRYEMAEVTAETPFRVGHYGIREPISPCLIPTDQIDLIAVPGVAFDPQGHRLGRGGGYYDRLIKGFGGCTAAIAFDFQILARIPVDAHDQPVQHIVTETKIFNI